MSYSITELKADTEAAFHGTTINKIRNFYGIANRAASRCILDVDFAEMKRVVPLSSPFFSGVYDYPCMTDLKGDRLVDLRVQAGRTQKDGFSQTYAKNFDQNKSLLQQGVQASVRWNGAVKTLRIAIPITPALVLSDCESTSGWTASGTASNLVSDTQNFFEGSASLRFDITTGTGYLTNSTLTAVDLSTIEGIGSLFSSVSIPSANLTSVSLRWGSSATDYWEVTSTLDHTGNAFQLGWNTAEFAWPATSTGSPDETAITYVRLAFVAAASMVGVRVDSVTGQLGKIYEAEYYSKYMFRDGTTGAFKEKVTADSDLINLDTDSYEVYRSCFFWMIGQQLQGLDAATADGTYNQQNYIDTKDQYVLTHKSEVSLPVVPYYGIKRGGYSGYIGKRLLG